MAETPSDSGKSDRNTQFAVLLLEVKQPLATSVLLSSVACLHRPRHFVEAASKSRVKLEDVRCVLTGNSIFYLRCISVCGNRRVCFNCIQDLVLNHLFIFWKNIASNRNTGKMIFRTLKAMVQIEIITSSGWESFL